MASNQGVPPPTYNQLMVLLAKVCQSQLTANERFTQLMDMHEKTLRTVTETTQMLKAMADNNNIFKVSTTGYSVANIYALKCLRQCLFSRTAA